MKIFVPGANQPNSPCCWLDLRSVSSLATASDLNMGRCLKSATNPLASSPCEKYSLVSATSRSKLPNNDGIPLGDGLDVLSRALDATQRLRF